MSEQIVDFLTIYVRRKPSITINIGINIPEPMHEALVKGLWRNHDLFAWLAREMPNLGLEIA